jgi:methylenetetrahydrofolate dehydrogenase (NADP+)/methenyltetrahydrofolate cyclohydrolase
MERIDGKEIAERIYSRIGDKSGCGIKLAVIMAGGDKATEAFIAQKRKAAVRTGIGFEVINLPGEVTTKEFKKALTDISQNPEITAIVTQLPFPPGVDKLEIISAIPYEKDADALNGGGLIPPSAGTVLEIIDYLGQDISFLNFAVVGYGELVGKPVHEFLSKKAKSVKLFRRGDSFEALSGADVVISGTGSPRLITPAILKNNSIVIDFGYGQNENGKIEGDFYPGGSDKNILYTPTPGGTGPILVAKLFENIVLLKN